MAEVVRGGLQAIPKAQVEAARRARPRYWQTQRKIVLPQALALVVPSIMNSFISIFKDTSLVTIVSHVRADRRAAPGARRRRLAATFKIEGYLFIAADLLHLLLRDVALQPCGSNRLGQPDASLGQRPPCTA